MSLKLIIGFFLLVFLSAYVAFLNPHEIEIYLTQDHSLRLPLAVFIFCAILTGVLLTSFFTGIQSIRESLIRIRNSIKKNRQDKLNRKWESLFRKGENAFFSGHQKKGAALFKKILAGNPHHIGSLDHLGTYLMMEGKFDEAIKVHEQAVRLDPKNIKILYSLSEDYSAAEHHAKETSVLEAILNLDHDSLPTLRRLRDAKIKMKKWEEAYENQKSILHLTRDAKEKTHEQNRFSQIICARGTELARNGDSKSAVGEFKRAIKENRHSLPAYVNLGDLHLQNDNTKGALKTWKAGFENTHSPLCLLRIQKVYLETDKFNEVVKLYQGAIQNSSNAAKETFSIILGALHLEQKNWEEAIHILESLTHFSPLARLLTVKAYEEKNQGSRVSAFGQSPLELVINQVYQYFCEECEASLEVWSEYCPSCQAWNSVNLGKPQNSF